MISLPNERENVWWRIVELVSVAAIYALLSRVGQLVAIEPGNVTAIFPAAGFAFAMILLGGNRLAPGVWLGSFLGNSWAFIDQVSLPIAVAVGGCIGTGAALQAYFGAEILRRRRSGTERFRGFGYVFVFLTAAVFSCLISSTIGVVSLSLGGLADWTNYLSIWATWYLGDTVGVITLAPVLLTTHTIRYFADRRLWQLEALALFAVAVGLTAAIFSGLTAVGVRGWSVEYFVTAPILWAIFRFNLFGATTLILLISGIAAWGTAIGYGPFQAEDNNLSLLLVQLFAAHSTIASLLLNVALNDRRDATEDLRRSENRFRSVFQSGATGIVVTEVSGNFLQVNRRFQEIVGYREDELLNMSVADVTHPDDRGETRELIRQLVAGQQDAFQIRKQYVRKDRKIVSATTYVSLVHDAAGNTQYLTAIVIDITKRLRAEAAQRESDERFQTLFEQAPEAILIFDADAGHFTDANPRAETLFKLPREKLTELTPVDISPPTQPDGRSTLDQAQGIIRNTLAGKKPVFEWIHQDSEGNQIPCEVRLVRLPSAGRQLIRASILDISERKEAEQKIRESEEKYRDLFENTGDLIQSVAPDGSLLYVNEAWRIALGYQKRELKRLNVFDIIHPGDLEHCQKLFRQVMGGEPALDVRVRFKTKDGRTLYLEGSSNCKFEDGQPVATRGIFHDVTKRKLVETELVETEQRLHAIIDNTTSLVYLKDLESRYLLVNNAFAELFNCKPSDFVGKTAQHFFDAEVARRFEENDEKVRQTGGVVQTEEEAPVNGELHTYLSVKFPLRNQKNEIYAIAGISTDISDRIEFRDELARSNRDLQQFAHVASHDLQEPLRAVSGFCQLLARRYEDTVDETGKDYLGHIVDGVSRMQSLLTGLLEFSRINARDEPFTMVDSNVALADAMANLRATIEDAGAVIESGDLPTVWADESQIVQLFQNLIANAIKYCNAGPPRIKIDATKQDGEFLFSVQDNGIGIDMNQAERIFVIFQRLHTRQEFPGTGIGLAICKRIVDRHQGRIWVDAELDHGSTFYFTLKARQRVDDSFAFGHN